MCCDYTGYPYYRCYLYYYSCYGSSPVFVVCLDLTWYAMGTLGPQFDTGGREYWCPCAYGPYRGILLRCQVPFFVGRLGRSSLAHRWCVLLSDSATHRHSRTPIGGHYCCPYYYHCYYYWIGTEYVPGSPRAGTVLLPGYTHDSLMPQPRSRFAFQGRSRRGTSLA